jgi:hypothetical protein
MIEDRTQDRFSISLTPLSVGNHENKERLQCPVRKLNTWLFLNRRRRFLSEVLDQPSTTIIFNDNQGAGQLSKNQVFHNRTKHVDIRHHFIREAVGRGDIKVEYLPTDQMPADVLTKGLSSPKQNKCIHALGMTTTT